MSNLNTMMNFEEFKGAIEKEILVHLPEDFKDSKVEVRTVLKNNNALTGLVVLKTGSNMAPTIYLEPFFERYESGEKTMDDVIDEVTEMIVKHSNPSFTGNEIIEKIRNFEVVKSLILPKIIGMDDNEELLKTQVYTPMANLAVTYRIRISDTDGLATTAVTQQLMDMWNISLEELHEIAVENMKSYSPSYFTSMREMLLNTMCHSEEEREEMSKMIPDDGTMFVLTNEQKLNGAAALLDEAIINTISERFSEGFYVLPSSIHEVLIIPNSAGFSPAELKSMVCDVNATQVAPEDRLANSVYQFIDKKFVCAA